MSFNFSASGKPEEVISSLAKLTSADLGNDQAGITTRDMIAELIGECSDDLEPHQVYIVRAHGHSGGSAGFTLSVTVELGDRHEPQ